MTFFELLAAHRLQQRMEMTVIVADDGDITIAGRIDVVRRLGQTAVTIAGARRKLAAAAVIHSEVRAQRCVHGFLH